MRGEFEICAILKHFAAEQIFALDIYANALSLPQRFELYPKASIRFGVRRARNQQKRNQREHPESFHFSLPKIEFAFMNTI